MNQPQKRKEDKTKQAGTQLNTLNIRTRMKRYKARNKREATGWK